MAMPEQQDRTVRLADYCPPPFLVDTVHLYFDLRDEYTEVRSELRLHRNPAARVLDSELWLDGEQLELLELSLDGERVPPSHYRRCDRGLALLPPTDVFTLSCLTRIRPQDNTALEGLYLSRGMYCTQCEAEGFRRITYFPDRPDVLSIFTVEVEADRHRYPVLLSNGNCTSRSASTPARHRAVWHDPHPKPCYLFALVAGDLTCVESSFRTVGDRDVALHMWVEAKDSDKCEHALASLRAAMRWDEVAYGREYDLDVFNIVAVDDFNMGAMENKGLNIFNTACVLATPDVTTDAGYQRVESIVAHEYFHNWSGNRVTCRDWFQLSLKEGFTVFRDNQFSAAMGSAAVQRIEHVRHLRTVQFAEDAGPMAHPVRPDSYQEISNFYTMTVYEKGAEVVRMLHTLLGEQIFRQGTDLYFDRHDGQAVTCEDFIAAMEAASGLDLAQFRRWYEQAGTPVLHLTAHYEPVSQRYSLTVRQSCPATPGQPDKLPLLMPLQVALVGEGGCLEVALAHTEAAQREHLLTLTGEEQEFVFTDVTEAPALSVLRGFSAPVRVVMECSEARLLRLLRTDDDGFSRWDAATALYTDCCARLECGQNAGKAVSKGLVDALTELLRNSHSDSSLCAELLEPPSLSALMETRSVIDVSALHLAREQMLEALGRALTEPLLRCYHENASRHSYAATGAQLGTRRLRNLALALLVAGDREHLGLASQQLDMADNLTDRVAALRLLVRYADAHESAIALSSFYARWSQEPLVVNQWLELQAANPRAGGVGRIEKLLEHEAFSRRNPNRVRAVLGAFAHGNPSNFHAADGSGYALVAREIAELDGLNPQVAARLALALAPWQKHVPGGNIMREQLSTLSGRQNLSDDLAEIVSKSLAGAAT